MNTFWIITVISLGLTAFFTCLVLRRSNDKLFDQWVKEFEAELGREVSKEDKIYVLSHLYMENWSIQQSVKRYKEMEGIK